MIEKTLLITGVNGQVGWELLRANNTPKDWLVIGLTREDLDLTHPEKISALFDKYQPDLFINPAAYTAVDKAESDEDLAFKINAEAVSVFSMACRDRGVPMVHLSTDYVFDGTKEDAYSEEDPVAPLGVYGRSKEAGERLLRTNLEQHIILRTAWVYGRHGNNFVKTMMRLGAERDELGIVADQHGCPTSAQNIAEAVIDIARGIFEENTAWGTYHFCGAEPTTWYDFAVQIFKNADLKVKANAIKTEDYPTPAARPKNSVLSCEKLQKAFAISPPSWQESLRVMMDDIRD